MLFHYPPYISSDPLHLSEADIGVVVEVSGWALCCFLEAAVDLL
jgi:hypothetical protein